MPERTAVVMLTERADGDALRCAASLARSDAAVKLVVVSRTAPPEGFVDNVGKVRGARVLETTPDHGSAQALNRGLEEAVTRTSCEFFLLLHDRVSLRRDTLVLMEGFMDEHPGAGMVAGPIVFADDPGRLYYGRGRVDWRRGGGAVPGFGGRSMTELALRGGRVTFAPSCAMLVRREAIEKIGKMDEQFLEYEDGTDISIRVRQAGYSIFYCPEAMMEYRAEPIRKGRRSMFPDLWSPLLPDYENRAFHLVRNAIVNARKHARGRNVLVFRLAYPLFVLWKSSVAARVVGPRAFRAPWQGFLAGRRTGA